MKKIIVLVITVLTIFLSAEDVKIKSKAQEFLIQNKNTNSIIKYLLLKPQSQLKFKVTNADTLEIFSRALDKPYNDYSYILRAKGEKAVIQKSARTSSVSETISGEAVSTYNKVTLTDMSGQEVVFENNCSKRIIIKINAPNSKNKKKIEYISFTPTTYDSTVILQVKNKNYTYYDSKKIEFDVEGPLYIKIISRLVFDNTLVDSYNYRYQVYLDDEIFGEYREKAYKSNYAILPSLEEKIPSSGDVNIIKIPAGKHNVKVLDNNTNRHLIFKFYISKSAVKVEKQ